MSDSCVHFVNRFGRASVTHCDGKCYGGISAVTCST